MATRQDLSNPDDFLLNMDRTNAQVFIVHSERQVGDISVMAYGIPEGDPTYWPETALGTRYTGNGILQGRNAGGPWQDILGASGYSGASGWSMLWETVTGLTYAEANTGYVANNDYSVVPIVLPDTCEEYEIISVCGRGDASWKLIAGINQTIQYGNTATNTGGFIQSTDKGDTIEIICTVANTKWEVLNSIGNLSVSAVGSRTLSYVGTFGSGGSGNSKFNQPYYVAIDSYKNVYVTDYINNRVQKFDKDGTYILQWSIMYPMGIAIDTSNNVYVANNTQNKVNKYDSLGNYISTLIDSTSDNGTFGTPYGITIDSADKLYVTSNTQCNVRKFNLDGTFILKWGTAGDIPGTGDGEFDNPVGIRTDSLNNVYVADHNNHRIQKFTSTGIYVTQWGGYGTGNGKFNKVIDVATDAGDNIYISDFHNNRVQVFDSAGIYIDQWGSYGSGEGEFSAPLGLATNLLDRFYVVDQGNNKLQMFTTIASVSLITQNCVNMTPGISGASGISGATGISGWSGWSGASGISGAAGTSGWSGLSGQSGLSGYSGDTSTDDILPNTDNTYYIGESGHAYKGIVLADAVSGYYMITSVSGAITINQV